MAKITLSNILSGFSLQRINDNFQKIADELNERVLYRDNPLGESNVLKTDIDANSHHIFNIPAPITDNEPARLKDVKNAIAGLAGITANLINFEPTARVPSNNVQGAIEVVEKKFRDVYVNVMDEGVLGDGSDETSKLQAVLNIGKSVVIPTGLVVGITSELTSNSPNITITGGGTIKLLSSYNKAGGTLSALAISGENTTIDAVTFDGSALSVGASLNNRFIWCTAPRLKVTEKASFISLPKGGTNFNGAIGCNAAAPYASVIGAYFYGNPGGIFFQGRNCVAQGNRIINPNDVAIALNGTNCYGCSVVGNIIDNEALNSCSALIAMEEGAAQWVVEGNRLSGINNGVGISALNIAVTTDVRGGTIKGNVINGGGGTTTNPAALISVSPHYLDVQIVHNELYGCPTGHSGTAMILACSSGTVVADNILDGVSATGLAALMLVYGGSRGITVKDNVSRLPANQGRHILIGADNYYSVPISFEGGKFYGGSEMINAERDIASITNLEVHIRDIQYSESTTRLNAFTLLGDRCTAYNSGGWAKPHRIGVFTEMYTNAVPTSSGRQVFNSGDKLFFLSPAAGTAEGVMRVAGAWRSLASIT